MGSQLFYTYNSNNGTYIQSSSAIKNVDTYTYSLVFDKKRKTIWAQNEEYGTGLPISISGNKAPNSTYSYVISGITVNTNDEGKNTISYTYLNVPSYTYIANNYVAYSNFNSYIDSLGYIKHSDITTYINGTQSTNSGYVIGGIRRDGHILKYTYVGIPTYVYLHNAYVNKVDLTSSGSGNAVNSITISKSTTGGINTYNINVSYSNIAATDTYTYISLSTGATASTQYVSGIELSASGSNPVTYQFKVAYTNIPNITFGNNAKGTGEAITGLTSSGHQLTASYTYFATPKYLKDYGYFRAISGTAASGTGISVINGIGKNGQSITYSYTKINIPDVSLGGSAASAGEAATSFSIDSSNKHKINISYTYFATPKYLADFGYINGIDTAANSGYVIGKLDVSGRKIKYAYVAVPTYEYLEDQSYLTLNELNDYLDEAGYSTTNGTLTSYSYLYSYTIAKSGFKISNGFKVSYSTSLTKSSNTYADIYVPYMTNEQYGVAKISLPYKSNISFAATYNNGYYGITRDSNSGNNHGKMYAYIHNATGTAYGTMKITSDYHYSPASGTTTSNRGSYISTQQSYAITRFSYNIDSKGHLIDISYSYNQFPTYSWLASNYIPSYIDILSNGAFPTGLKLATGYIGIHTTTGVTYSTYSYADIYVPYMTEDQYGVGKLSLPYKSGISFTSSYSNGYYGITRESGSTNNGRMYAYIHNATGSAYGTMKITSDYHYSPTSGTTTSNRGSYISTQQSYAITRFSYNIDSKGHLINISYSYNQFPTYNWLSQNYAPAPPENENYITSYTDILSNGLFPTGLQVAKGYKETYNGETIAYTYADIYVPHMTNAQYGVAKTYYNTIVNSKINDVTSTTNRYYGIQKNSDGKLIVNVPWIDHSTNINILSQSIEALQLEYDNLFGYTEVGRGRALRKTTLGYAYVDLTGFSLETNGSIESFEGTHDSLGYQLTIETINDTYTTYITPMTDRYYGVAKLSYGETITEELYPIGFNANGQLFVNPNGLNRGAGIYFGWVTTPSHVAAKDVTVAETFTLVTGVIVFVQFVAPNTNTGTITLNINNTGAFGIKKYERFLGTDGNPAIQMLNVSISPEELTSDKTFLFRYDGTYWVIIDAIENGGSGGPSNAITYDDTIYQQNNINQIHQIEVYSTLPSTINDNTLYVIL